MGELQGGTHFQMQKKVTGFGEGQAAPVGPRKGGSKNRYQHGLRKDAAVVGGRKRGGRKGGGTNLTSAPPTWKDGWRTETWGGPTEAGKRG